MNKIYFLSILITLTSFNFNSPTYDVNWGPTYKKEGGIFSGYHLVGIHNDHYYVLMQPRKKNLMLKYNMNHELVSSKQLDMKHNGKYLNISKIIKTQNGDFGQMITYDKKNKKMRLFTSELKNGSFAEPREVYAHDFRIHLAVNFYALTNFTNSDASTLIASSDKSHVVYTNVQSSIDQKSKEELSVAVFDANMNVVWKKTQQFDYQDKKLEIEQTVVGNDGVVYIIAKAFDKKKNKGLPKYSFKAFRITAEGMQEYKISLGSGYSPTDAGIYFPNNSKDFIISGFYTMSGKNNAAMGTFYASGDSETGIKEVKKEKFNRSFLEGLNSKRQVEKNNGLRSGFSIKNFLQFADGSLGFIAEHSRSYETTSTDSEGRKSRRTVFEANELIIPRFNSDGALSNIQKIDKSFSSGSPLASTYSIGLYDDKTYLVFNDHKSKSERKEMGQKKKKGVYTDLVVIDKNGDIAYNETLFNSNETDTYFFSYLTDYSDDTFLLGSVAGKKYSFGKLKMQ